MKDPLVRFSVAIGGELLQRFDEYRERHQYPNRSEAIRGLMRDALIQQEIARDDTPAMGVVILIYDHHAGRVAERLTEIQHQHLECVLTTTHVHLDASRCLELILLRGAVKTVRELADGLIGTKGVETGQLVITAAAPIDGEAESPRPGHSHSHGAGEHSHRHG